MGATVVVDSLGQKTGAKSSRNGGWAINTVTGQEPKGRHTAKSVGRAPPTGTGMNFGRPAPRQQGSPRQDKHKPHSRSFQKVHFTGKDNAGPFSNGVNLWAKGPTCSKSWKLKASTVIKLVTAAFQNCSCLLNGWTPIENKV